MQTLKFYTIGLALLLIIAATLSVQDVGALTGVKVVKGKLTTPADYRPFGGEEVGKFKMKISKDHGNILKVEMNRPPEKGYEYLVGTMDESTGYRDVFTGFRSESKVIMLKDLWLPGRGSVLFVTEHFKYDTVNYGGTYIAAAPVPELTDPSPLLSVEELERANEAIKDDVRRLKEKGVPIVDHFVGQKPKAIVFVLEEWSQDYLAQIMKIVPEGIPVRAQIAQ